MANRINPGVGLRLLDAKCAAPSSPRPPRAIVFILQPTRHGSWGIARNRSYVPSSSPGFGGRRVLHADLRRKSFDLQQEAPDLAPAILLLVSALDVRTSGIRRTEGRFKILAFAWPEVRAPSRRCSHRYKDTDRRILLIGGLQSQIIASRPRVANPCRAAVATFLCRRSQDHQTRNPAPAINAATITERRHAKLLKAKIRGENRGMLTATPMPKSIELPPSS